MNLRRFILFFAGIFVCLYFAFSPAVSVPYVHHDSLRYFHKFFNAEANASIDPQREWISALGRPLASKVETFIYKKINHLSDVSHLRLMTIAIFALSASLLGEIVMSWGFETIPAFCLSLAIFTLPGIQECVFVPFLSIALSVLLSLSAYMIWKSGLMWAIRFMLTFVFLEAAFFTYASSVSFFLIPCAFLVIFQENNWSVSQKAWLKDVCLWILTAVIYYFLLKILFYTKLQVTNHEINFSSGLLLANVKTFFPQCVLQTFNLWNIYNPKHWGASLAIFTGVIWAGNCFYRKSFSEVHRTLAIFALFLIFNTVWFMFGLYLPRTFMGSQALTVILIYWAGQWLLRRWHIYNRLAAFLLCIIFMLIGLISSHITMNNNVLNSNAELMFIRSRLAQYSNSSTQQIHIIRAQTAGTKGYNGLTSRYDNFNTSFIVDNEASDLIRAALKDYPLPIMHCIVTISDHGQPYKLLSNSIVIDLNDLIGTSKWKKYINRNFDSSKSSEPVSTVIYPNDFDYTLSAGNYSNQGQYAQALINYDKAIAINPYNASAYCNRGVIYANQGNLPQAIADFGKAIASDPHYAVAYDNRAICYLRVGDYVRCWQDVRKSQALGLPVNPALLKALKAVSSTH